MSLCQLASVPLVFFRRDGRSGVKYDFLRRAEEMVLISASLTPNSLVLFRVGWMCTVELVGRPVREPRRSYEGRRGVSLYLEKDLGMLRWREDF